LSSNRNRRGLQGDHLLGDGATCSGAISGTAGGPFAVKGKHTDSSAGTYHPYVTLQDRVDKSTYTSSKGKATVD
jgi:hypothetical protein